MAAGFEHWALQFLHSYGYAALFVLLALETSMVLHFVPSEVVVTVATAILANTKAQLALVIVVSTLGATAGSLMLYAFARYGGRRFLERHPHFFGLNAQRRERLETWFRHPAGESLVFFLRMLPFLRAAVSIPAGFAEMGVRKFTIYSAAGSLLFNAALAYSTYAARTNPGVMAELRIVTAYATSRWPFFLALALLALVGVYLLYRRRRTYRQAPELAVRHVLRTSAVGMIGAGVILLGSSFFLPGPTYRAVTWIAVDAGRLAEQYHIWALLFLLSIGLGAITLGLVALTVSPILERLTRVAFDRWRARRLGYPRGRQTRGK